MTITGTPRRRRRYSILGSLAVLLMFLTSCSNDVVFSKYQTFTEAGWAAKDTAVFDVDITDTKTLNNISLMVRHGDSYPYSNLFLFVITKYPDGTVLSDTMEILLANKKGEWLGSGAGDIFDAKIPVKKNVRFPLAGNYKFIFVQGMRVDPLPMLMDFGFEIQKTGK